MFYRMIYYSVLTKKINTINTVIVSWYLYSISMFTDMLTVIEAH